MLIPCERHPERDGVLAISLPYIGIARYWCKECRDAYDATYPSRGFGRAYATGLGPDVHAEAQEAQRQQTDFDNAKPFSEQRGYL